MTSGGNNFYDFPENQLTRKNYSPTFSRKHPASTCQWSGRPWVYETAQCPSVCPIRPLQQHAAGLLLQEVSLGRSSHSNSAD